MSVKALLEVTNVTKFFGGFQALDGISFAIQPGEVMALVGPNGSGKTTCINLISGVYPLSAGTITFKGQPISNKKMYQVAQLGINRTFQVPKPFKSLTVAENVSVAAGSVKRAQRLIDDPLAFVGLDHLANREASTLNSTQQKLLDLARALATGPELLLVDELAAGLSLKEADEIVEKLLQLAKTGISLLVVEHLLGFVDRLTKRVVVMSAGKEIFEGTLADASADPHVVEVFLGA